MLLYKTDNWVSQGSKLDGDLALWKPCTAGSRGLRNNRLKAKLLRPFGQRSDLLLAISGFIGFWRQGRSHKGPSTAKLAPL